MKAIWMLNEMMRRLASAPDDVTLARMVVSFMAREGRSDHLLEILLDRDTWNKSSEAAKLCAAYELDRRLQLEHEGQWRLEGLRDWSCYNDHEVGGRTYTTDISHRLALFTHLPTGAEFSLVPGLDFFEIDPLEIKRAGLTPEQERHFEGNRRQVRRVLKPFLVSRWPVTHRQFGKAVLGEERWGARDLPETGQSFGAVKTWLGFNNNNGFELPTPEQWEYACRAGSITRFFWGDEFDPSYVWYAGNSGDDSGVCHCGEDVNHSPHEGHSPVEMKEAPRPHSPKEHDDAGKHNAFGLVDCIGNVWEWLSDGQVVGGCFGSRLTDAEYLTTPGRPLQAITTDNSTRGFRPVVALPGLDQY